jgi:predicted Rossmann-fold nucleotide-binding protein
MEEFFEVLSWAQLGMHDKPCGLLNAYGYYQHIVQFLDYAVQQDFLKPRHRALLIVEPEPRSLLDRFEQFIATHAAQHFDRTKT